MLGSLSMIGTMGNQAVSLVYLGSEFSPGLNHYGWVVVSRTPGMAGGDHHYVAWHFQK